MVVTILIILKMLLEIEVSECKDERNKNKHNSSTTNEANHPQTQQESSNRSICEIALITYPYTQAVQVCTLRLHYEGANCVSHTSFSSGHLHVKTSELVYNKNKPTGARTCLRNTRDQMHCVVVV